VHARATCHSARALALGLNVLSAFQFPKAEECGLRKEALKLVIVFASVNISGL